MTSSQYKRNFDDIKWGCKRQRPRIDRKRSKRGIEVIKDIEPFISPIDGNTIGSRSVLREHERRHNVRQIGNDWAGSERPINWDQVKNVRH